MPSFIQKYKKIFATGLFLLIAFSSVPTPVFGQTTSTPKTFQECADAGGQWDSGYSAYGGNANGAGCKMPDGSWNPEPPPKTTTKEDNICTGISGTLGMRSICGAIATLIFLPIQISSFLLWVAGNFLDWVIKLTVLDIRTSVDELSGINITWSLIRDLINISFIFILLYTAIRIIIGKEGTGQIAKLIPGIVIAVVLINFSLFFAKVIIDVSNMAALTIHEAVVTTCSGTGQRVQLSYCFAQPLGLNTIFNVGEDPSGNASLIEGLNYDFGKAAVISLGGTIFLLIATFVFFTVGFMFLSRFIIILFLLIFSPVAVVGTIVPKLGEYSKKWWGSISDQAIFPPAFMLMSWITLSIANSPGFIRNNLASGENTGDVQAISKIFEGNAVSSMNLIVNFFILSAFMIATIIISKKMASHGGNLGMKMAGTAIGLSAFAGRSVGGRAGQAMSQSERLKNLAADENSAVKRFAGRMALKGASKASKGSWDLRASTPMERMNEVTGGLGLGKIDLGKAGGKGGFAKKAEDGNKEELKFAESLKMSDLEKDRRKKALEAQQKALEEADLNNPGFVAEHEQEKLRRQRAADYAERGLELAREKRAKTKRSSLTDEQWKHLENDIAKNEAEFESAKNASDNINTIDKYRDERLTQVNRELDAVEGVDEEKAKKRRIEEMVRSGEAENKKGAAKILNERLENKEEKLKTVDSIGTARMKRYAEAQTKAPELIIDLGALGKGTIPVPHSNRVGFFGKIRREQQELALQIQKKTKSKKAADEIFEKLKKEVEKDGSDGNDDKPAGDSSKTDTPPATPPASP